MRRRRVALLIVVGIAAACGTRLPDEAFVADGSVATGGSGVASANPGAQGTRATVFGSAPIGASTSGESTPGARPPAGSGNAGQGEGGGSAAPATPGGAGPNQASDVGVTETTLRIGTIVAENGLVGNAFQPAVTGLRSWVETVNAAGGIGGRTIELFSCDDREDRARTLECARHLVEDEQVFALIGVNTRSFGGAALFLHEQGIPVMGFPINNSFRRFPHMYDFYSSPYVRDGSTVGHNGQVVNYSTPYRYFREQMGLTRAAVVTYDIAESRQGGDFFAAGLESEGFSVVRYTVSFAAPSFDAAVADMERQDIELLADGLDPGANRRLCDAMARRGFTVAVKLTTIVSVGSDYGDQFNEVCRPVTFAPGDSRIFTDTSDPIVAAFNEGMARYQPGQRLHQWSLEAWVQGELLRDALETMGPAPTPAGYEEFLRSRRGPYEGVVAQLQWVPDDPPLSAPTVRDCGGISRWDDASGGWVAATPFPYCVDDAHQFFNDTAEDGT